MLKFLRTVLATIVGLMVFTFLVIFVGGAILSGIAASEDRVEVEENTVLHLELNKPIVEREADDPLTPAEFIPGADGGSMGLIEILQAIKHAKKDDKIKGIYLEAQFVMAGYSSLKEIRDALVDFKQSGKWVFAYNEIYTEKDYYLASVADKVYLNPGGQLEFNGLAQEVVFIKGTLEKLGIEPQVFRVGAFKSAVEPLLRTNMSDESKEQINSFLNHIYNVYLEDVAVSRSLDRDKLEEISDAMLVRNANDAITHKLVDQLGYKDEVNADIRQRLGLPEKEDDEEEINFIKYKKYKKTIKSETSGSDRVAVIVATGDIVSGNGDQQSIGSDKFAEEIRKARLNDRVKAIVIRVNSPGGSALASDVIWREVVLAKQVKPVIASMSDVAASGGYYISMAADTIVAQPNTITGSIGIFGVLFNMEKFLNDKLGITTDVVETGELSNLLKVTKPLSEYEKSIIQKNVEEGYEEFVTKAAKGRNMPVEKLKEVASGRVWSGVEAKDRGLVDVLGSFEDAIQIAATKAGLEEGKYRIKYYPEQKSFVEQLVEKLSGEVEAKIMQEKMGEFYPYFRQLEKVKQYQGIQARLPYDAFID